MAWALGRWKPTPSTRNRGRLDWTRRERGNTSRPAHTKVSRAMQGRSTIETGLGSYRSRARFPALGVGEFYAEIA